MKIKNKLLISIIAIIVIIMGLICTVSIAANKDHYKNNYKTTLDNIKDLGGKAVGTKGKVGYSALYWRDDLYCVMNGVRLGEDVEYEVDWHLNIIGNQIQYVDENGDVHNETAEIGGRVAYILGQGKNLGDFENEIKIENQGYGIFEEHKESVVQKALWLNLNELNHLTQEVAKWKNVHLDSVGNDSVEYCGDKEAVDQLNSDAETYAKSQTGGSGDIEANDNKTQKDNIKVTSYSKDNKGYVRVGPFNWEFGGKIHEVRINNGTIKNIKYSHFVGDDERFYTGCGNIKSGEDFYISLEAESGATKIENIKVNTKIKAGKYVADIWHLKITDRQNLILVNTESSPRRGLFYSTI